MGPTDTVPRCCPKRDISQIQAGNAMKTRIVALSLLTASTIPVALAQEPRQTNLGRPFVTSAVEAVPGAQTPASSTAGGSLPTPGGRAPVGAGSGSSSPAPGVGSGFTANPAGPNSPASGLTRSCCHLYTKVIEYGAVGDGITDDTAAIQAAIDAANGMAVWFEPTLHYKTTGTLFIVEHMSAIEGNNAVIEYYGDGDAIEVGPLSNGYYPNDCWINWLGVTLNSGDVAWKIKATQGIFTKLTALLKGNDQTGFQLCGDPLGTGSNENTFLHCNAFGGVHSGLANHRGWYLSYDPATPGLGPNANRWFGGRTESCTVAFRILGLNNIFYSPTVEGTTERVFWFDNPDSIIGCVENFVYSPYVKGSAGVEIAVIGAHSIRSGVLFPYITGTFPGEELVDQGAGTVYSSAGRMVRMPSGNHTLVKEDGSQYPTVSGTLPGYIFHSPDNGSSVIVRNHSAYSEGSRYFDVVNGNNDVLLAAGTNSAQVKAKSLLLDDGTVGIYSGSGIPTINAPVGSLFLRTDGTVGATLYVRESTGWAAK